MYDTGNTPNNYIHLCFTLYFKGRTVNDEVKVAMSKTLRIAAILDSGGSHKSPFLFDLGCVGG